MKRYRKKPVVIEATQWDGSAEGATPIINWILEDEGVARYRDYIPNVVDDIAIDTLEGTMSAEEGDWIIKGVAGEFYPCKPAIFDRTYEPAE